MTESKRQTMPKLKRKMLIRQDRFDTLMGCFTTFPGSGGVTSTHPTDNFEMKPWLIPNRFLGTEHDLVFPCYLKLIDGKSEEILISEMDFEDFKSCFECYEGELDPKLTYRRKVWSLPTDFIGGEKNTVEIPCHLVFDQNIPEPQYDINNPQREPYIIDDTSDPRK